MQKDGVVGTNRATPQVVLLQAKNESEAKPSDCLGDTVYKQLDVLEVVYALNHSSGEHVPQKMKETTKFLRVVQLLHERKLLERLQILFSAVGNFFWQHAEQGVQTSPSNRKTLGRKRRQLK